MNQTIQKAYDLIKELDFQKAFDRKKKYILESLFRAEQSGSNIAYLEGESLNITLQLYQNNYSYGRIDYQKALSEKQEVLELCQHELEQTIDKQDTLKRWSKTILNFETEIATISGGGDIGMGLFGALWATSEMLIKQVYQITSLSNNNIIPFDSSMDLSQVDRLFEELKNNNYIAQLTQKEDFRMLFGLGNNSKSFETIEWVDLSPTRKAPNKQTLFCLLYLLKSNTLLTNHNFEPSANLYKKIERLFSNEFKNLSESNPQKVDLKTPRHELLKTIIQSILV